VLLDAHVGASYSGSRPRTRVAQIVDQESFPPGPVASCPKSF
jgi:hypothetical protein